MLKFRTLLRNIGCFAPTARLRKLLFRMGGVRIGSNVTLPRGTIIKKNVIIGENVEIWQNVFIGSRTIIGDNVKLEADVFLYQAHIGEYTVIHKGASVCGNSKDRAKVGKHSYVGYHALLDGTERLEVGDFVHIAGPAVGIFTHSSVKNAILGNVSGRDENYRDHQILKPVSVGNNCWIGGNVIIYPGITVGHHSAILPNSVVKEDVDPYSMVGGQPATLKKKIIVQNCEVRFVKEQKPDEAKK